MILSRRLAGDFSPTVRDRGKSYYWQGRVRIHHGSDSLVEALVRGTRKYEVSLDYEDGVLFTACDCDNFNPLSPCKHVWATILAAESRGYLQTPAQQAELLLEPIDLHAPAVPPPPPPPRIPAWKNQIAGLTKPAIHTASPVSEWPEKREILYIVEGSSSIATGGLVIRLMTRDRKLDGTYGREVSASLKRNQIARLPRQEDREILAPLAGGLQHYGWSIVSDNTSLPDTSLVPHPLADSILRLAVRTGRCYVRTSDVTLAESQPVTWDDGGAWEFRLEIRSRPQRGWMLAGILRRGDERMEMADATLVTPGGFVFAGGRVAPLAADTPFQWVAHFRRPGQVILISENDTDDLLATLLCSKGIPALDLPEELRYEETVLTPRPALRIRVAGAVDNSAKKVRAELSFDYDGRAVDPEEPSRGFFDASSRRLIRRDTAFENDAAALLTQLGMKLRAGTYDDRSRRWEMASSKLPRALRALVDAGWHIDADGKTFRRPGRFNIQVDTTLDWFELHGTVDYGETSAKLPALLEALRRGDNMVRLDDGTYGMMPEEWLRRVGLLAGAGAPADGHIRFRRTQAGLLDALLASQPEARCDEAFARIREELKMFTGVEPSRQPVGFVGRLRDYQCDGLGWMEFLRRFSFGGCLADDMGVGKTAQVLAMLETRRELRAAGQSIPASLIVVPRSLVFNWKQEAERFTPQLRVLDYTGADRDRSDFAGHDVILSTYGTLRQDVVHLKDVEFDYIVLDEAQTVKNSDTESSKAVRLLRGTHRLALSGTPVENHLGELWSIFEFLNPGMLGSAGVFKMAGSAGRNPDEETRLLLAHALRPFILRRTKEQVARELPSKTEQTVHCEMESGQRKLYDELRKHYRDSLLKRIETDGIAKSKIHVLEALLRLRQAACHPGLIDPDRSGENSGKLDVLLARLSEVREEGHKALVFSQFTSLLRIVRNRLDAGGVTYEYLDGATRNRQERVDRFQNDAACKLFLISLKAGGLGLNLTAADYVFLLDPWWNPAVEAQAVDRAHRIGQTRQVFAYRLIAKDTVEEKVLELQKTKRDLAAAIIGSGNSLIRTLRREDLEVLLS